MSQIDDNTLQEIFKGSQNRWWPPKTMVVFCDESSLGRERYFVIGALCTVPMDPGAVETTIAGTEAMLSKVKTQFSLDKTLKWRNVPAKGQYLDGYSAFMSSFVKIKQWSFRCFVVDTRKYPLNKSRVSEGNERVGYLTFFCTFLSDGVMKGRYEYFFDIRIDDYSFRPGDVRNLADYVERRFRGRAPEGANWYANTCAIKAVDDRNNNMIQLVDLLTGAVAFVWNGGMERDSKRSIGMKRMVEALQQGVGVDLSQPTPPYVDRFNIWKFESRNAAAK